MISFKLKNLYIHKEMKKLSLLLIMTVFAGIGVQAQYDQKALTVLDAMSNKYKNISSYSASIKSTMINEVDGINEEMNGEIIVKDDMFHLTIDEQEIYNDGETVWTYLPEINEVNIDNYDPDEGEITPSKIYTAYKEGYKYLHVEESVENGVRVDVIDLVAEDAQNSQFFKIRMFISQRDRSLISWTMFEKSGNQYKYSIEDFNPNVTVSASDFRFNVSAHPGVEVVDLR